jgi:20S proteasome alpha/beta subunit
VEGVTTIAYCDGLLAGDGITVVDDTVTSDMRKLWRLRDRTLIGCAGNAVEFPALVRWVRSGAKEENCPRFRDIQALVIRPDGRVYYFDQLANCLHPLKARYYAIGSGAVGALCAMHAGADAKSAVKAAIKHCQGSGPPVRTLRLNP